MRLLLTLTTFLLLLIALSPNTPVEAGKPTPVLIFTERVWADIRCDGTVDAADAMPVLLWIAGQQAITPPLANGCPSVFHGVSADGFPGTWRWGDVDCSNAVDIPDLIAILRAAASADALPSGACPLAAQSVLVAIVGK